MVKNKTTLHLVVICVHTHLRHTCIGVKRHYDEHVVGSGGRLQKTCGTHELANVYYQFYH